MPAQIGSGLVLVYGAQGAQQAGGALVLNYSAPAPTRRTVGALTRANWQQGTAKNVPVATRFLATTQSDPRHVARWGVGVTSPMQERANWVPTVPTDRAETAPWERRAAVAQPESFAAWAVSRATDDASRAPWGRYEALAEVLRGSLWVFAVPSDWRGAAPWGGPMLTVQLGRLASFAPNVAADRTQYVPWTLYTTLINAGWAAVIPVQDPAAPPEALYVVPVRSFYMTINSIELRKVAGNVALPAYAFSMSLDADSWTWSFSATLRNDALAHVRRAAGADPVEIEATVNGVPYRLRVERVAREANFPATRIRVSGRGLAATLAAPYSPVKSFGNPAAARTAQQLANDVLTVNGVPLGWTVDWQLTDWLVPAGAWAFQGSYIDAINDIASAGGGYVQPHRTAATLRVLPRYPTVPWTWGTAAPDVELPAAAVELESTEWIDKPAYNRVFVGGLTAGVFGPVTRTGTAGDIVAPQVTHALITAPDAHRQRGIAVLADTGRQAHLQLKLPLLAASGLILPGQLVRYLGTETTIGIVRRTSLDWSSPSMRQTLGVETYVA